MSNEHLIGYDSEGVKIQGHIGTWHTIDNAWHRGKRVFLMEHDEYGDEAACLIVDHYGNIIMEDVWNGFSDLV